MEKYLEQPGTAVQKINIIVVPGIAGQDLGEQTCLHFVPWFKEFFKRQVQMCEDTHITAWMFKHGLDTDSLDSLERYGFAGHDLLNSLNDMSIKGLHALIDANNKIYLQRDRTLLESIELLMMLGDPHFEDDNQLDWNRMIASCLPNAGQHYLERSVQVLRTISRKFEDLTVFSSLLQVSGSPPNGRKGLRFRKRSKHGGCLCDATVSVRLFTTQVDDVDIPGLPGNGKVCAFCPTSSHHSNLLQAGDDKNIHSVEANTSLLLLEGPAQEDWPVKKQSQQDQGERMEPRPSYDIAESSKGDADSTSESSSTSPRAPDASILSTGSRSPVAMNPSSSPAQIVFTDSSPDKMFEGLPSTGSGISTVDFGHNLQSTSSKASNATGSAPGNSPPPTSNISIGRSELSNVSEASAQVSPMQGESAKLPCFHAVPDRTFEFFGRREVLTELDIAMHKLGGSIDGAIAKPIPDFPMVCVLHGAAGIGKSSTVVEFASQHVQNFDAILWLNASTSVRLAQSYHRAAKALGLVKSRTAILRHRAQEVVKDWLQTTKARVLLVLDDLDNQDDPKKMKEYFPLDCKASVVITSRKVPKVLERLELDNLHTIEVGLFSVEEATAYLRAMAPDVGDTSDPRAAELLAKQFGCLPLALAQAAAFVRRTESSYESCLQLIANERSGREIYSNTTFIRSSRGLPWREPGESVHRELPSWVPDWTSVTLSHEASATFNVCAFYYSEDINMSILLGAVEGDGVALHDFPRTQRRCHRVTSELWDAALCSFDDSGFLRIHESVQESVRARLEPEEFQESFQTACELLLRRWPSSRKLRNLMHGRWREFESLLPHVTSLFRIYQESLPEEDRMTDTHSARHLSRVRQPVLSKPLLTDSFYRIVVMSSWYNALCGYESEERPLTEFARMLVVASSPSVPRTSRLDPELQTNPSISSFVIENLDNALFPAISASNLPSRPQQPAIGLQKCSEKDLNLAEDALREGAQLAAGLQYLDATGYFVRGREIVSAFKQVAVEAAELYARASFYLGLVYGLCGAPEIAEITITSAEELLSTQIYIRIDTMSQLLGCFALALGSIKIKSPLHDEEGFRLLQRAETLFGQDLADNESEDDWMAITSLKLADHFLACEQYQEAHTHLQKTIDHFQPQTTLSAQAQTCRALHRKSLIHNAENKTFENMMYMGAAKETWNHIRRAQGVDQSSIDASNLTKEDFDNAIPEFWLR